MRSLVLNGRHLFTLILLSPVLLASSCREGEGPTAPGKCEGKDRPQLDCSAEFKYDKRLVEGGFSVIGVGGLNAKTDEAAMRAIDKETEQYVAGSRRLCDEYNKCVIDKETYSTRAENLRRRMSKAPELYDAVKGATDEDARRLALAKAYTALVPDESRRELSLDFSVEARRPDESAAQTIRPGERLPTGTRVAFNVRPSKSAHIYLFQKSPDGKIDVLFPDARIPTKNPLAAGATLRIPSGDQSFKLNDKDIGTEVVYIVASLDPMSSLSGALDAVKAGKAADRTLSQVTSASPKSGEGCTRALELDEGSKCIRPRGLQLDEGEPGAARASFRARTEAADSVIVQAFAFEHTR